MEGAQSLGDDVPVVTLKRQGDVGRLEIDHRLHLRIQFSVPLLLLLTQDLQNIRRGAARVLRLIAQKRIDHAVDNLGAFLGKGCVKSDCDQVVLLAHLDVEAGGEDCNGTAVTKSLHLVGANSFGRGGKDRGRANQLRLRIQKTLRPGGRDIIPGFVENSWPGALNIDARTGGVDRRSGQDVRETPNDPYQREGKNRPATIPEN